jgi:hypothetical protein
VIERGVSEDEEEREERATAMVRRDDEPRRGELTFKQ